MVCCLIASTARALLWMADVEIRIHGGRFIAVTGILVLWCPQS